MEKNNSLKINVLINIILTVSSMIFPLITFKYASNILSPSGTGKVAFVNSIINYFLMIAMLGIPTYGIRACSAVINNKKELSKNVIEIWVINAIMTALSYCIFVFSLFLIPQFKNDRVIFFVSSFAIILSFTATEWFYKALGLYKYIAVRSLAFKLIALVLMFVTVKDVNDCVWYAAAVVIANYGYGIVNFINIHKYIEPVKFNKLNLKRHIRPILVFFGMVVAVSIYTSIDTTMLGFISGDKEVGYYDVAVKIKVILVNIVTAVGTVALPRAVEYVNGFRKLEFESLKIKALSFAFIIAIPATIFFSIYAKEVILIISDNSYIASVVPMRIIMPTLILIGISNILGIQVLIPMGKEKIVLASEIVGAGVDIVLNALFIPNYGAAGAAFGTLCAEAAVLTVQAIALKENILKDMKQAKVLSIVIAALIAGSISYFSLFNFSFNLYLYVLAAFMVYAIIFVIILIVLKEPITKSIVSMILGSIKKIRK